MQSIHQATDEQSRDSIYRFRYRVFADHLGRRDLDGADHEHQTIRDELDETALHFYCGEPNQPIAALTASVLANGALPDELQDFLEISKLAEATSLDRMLFTNWLLVEPAHAGSLIVNDLLMAAYDWALTNDIALVVTFCRPGLVSFYQRLGFEQYTHAKPLKGIGLRCPLLLVVRDGARLTACRSPLNRIFRRHGGDDRPDDVRLRLEPLIDMFQASQILANDELWMDSATVLVSRARPRLFDSLGEEHVRQIMKLTSVISCKPGEVVTRQGETSDDMFLIVSGSFEASAPGTPGRALGEGDLFGELEHLSLKPRSENVSALGAGHIAAFKAEALFHWMRRNPEPGVTLAVNLARLLAARLAA